MQVHMREALLQRMEQILVVADLQVRVQTALQQDSRAAEAEHLFDFLIDRLEREDVTVFGTERPVKCAEGAVFGAEIRVVDIAVDLVGHDAGVILFQARLVRGHPEAHKVIGLEHFERLLFRQSHGYFLGILYSN
jgi:hypothetical protein